MLKLAQRSFRRQWVAVNRRQQLLETALTLFSEQGVDGASMRELARRAGVNVAAAYHHFDSKRALLRAVFEELGSLDEIRARLEPDVLEILRQASRDDAIALIIQVSWGRMEANASYYGLLHAEVLRGDPDAQAVSLEMWQGWGAQLEDVVVAAGLAPHDAARELAELLRTLIWGLFNEARLTGDTGETRRRERARSAARFLARALR
jgi:AcrR family transcriptional regulator